MITIKVSTTSHRQRDIGYCINLLKNAVRNDGIMEEYSLHRFFLPKSEKQKAKMRFKHRAKTKYSQKQSGAYNGQQTNR